MFLFILIKTAHGRKEKKFQYISCSYSSESCEPDFFVPSRFQYISCSYSSIIFVQKQFEFLNFNTSHVLIHLWQTPGTLEEPKDFNTSHVLIHPCGQFDGWFPALFQYISCSYSSIRVDFNPNCNRYFNTSHVLIHLIPDTAQAEWVGISIHLMFLFIFVC